MITTRHSHARGLHVNGNARHDTRTSSTGGYPLLDNRCPNRPNAIRLHNCPDPARLSFNHQITTHGPTGSGMRRGGAQFAARFVWDLGSWANVLGYSKEQRMRTRAPPQPIGAPWTMYMGCRGAGGGELLRRHQGVEPNTDSQDLTRYRKIRLAEISKAPERSPATRP